MSFDCSRFTFNAWHDFLGVVMQQGRVQIDADWNELVAQIVRRMQVGSLDTFGQPVVPRVTPDGFRIEANGGALTIGVGRLYVDGLLAQNHGAAPLQWDALLAEQTGSVALDYNAQPYYPQPPALPGGGPHLVYLDVWQREVTHLQYPDVVEKAVGVDTTARLQTVWQVKLLPDVGTALCATPDEDVPGWDSVTAASGARLTTSTGAVAGTSNPCLIPPSGGYKGLENQLYRVEIHHGGNRAAASFKWSRDNATVASRVSHINAARDRLVVESLGRDAVLGFSDGEWIEVTDDMRELQGEPGVMARIAQGGGVDDATRTLVLETALPPGLFPVDVQLRNTRVRRWDQSGRVRRADGTLYIDLDVGSDGLIPVPPAGVALFLEDGILVNVDLDASGGDFHVGDYWSFAARTADASIELFDQMPPRGIHHHYARLGFVTFPGTISDCRTFWPPSIPEGGDNCACTVCVTPQAHASGQLTIQMAIDQVITAGGGTVCLEIGNYSLHAPVQIHGARSVKLVGKGIASRLVAISATGTVVVNKSQDIVLDAFSILCRGSINSPQEAVRVVASRLVRIEHLAIRVESEDPSWAAIGLADALMTLNVSENTVQAPIGIRSGSDPTGAASTGLADVRIENNEFDCTATAIVFAPFTVHQLLNRICGNRINGCKEGGLQLSGMTAPGFGLEVQSNVFSVPGHGIVAKLNGLRVLDNDLLQPQEADPKEQCGVLVLPGLKENIPLTDCHIVGNRIHGFSRAGIFVNAPLRTAMIKQNQISSVGIGLMLESRQVMDQVSIENNQFNDIHGIAIMGKGEGANYAATGNQIRTTRSSEPAVILEFASGDGIFSHNECYREGGGDAPDVRLQSSTLIVGNNRVVGGGLSLDIRAAQRHYTVLGNICRGKIMVEFGNGISSPWAPLNLEGVA